MRCAQHEGGPANHECSLSEYEKLGYSKERRPGENVHLTNFSLALKVRHQMVPCLAVLEPACTSPITCKINGRIFDGILHDHGRCAAEIAVLALCVVHIRLRWVHSHADWSVNVVVQLLGTCAPHYLWGQDVSQCVRVTYCKLQSAYLLCSCFAKACMLQDFCALVNDIGEKARNRCLHCKQGSGLVRCKGCSVAAHPTCVGLVSRQQQVRQACCWCSDTTWKASAT